MNFFSNQQNNVVACFYGMDQYELEKEHTSLLVFTFRILKACLNTFQMFTTFNNVIVEFGDEHVLPKNESDILRF